MNGKGTRTTSPWLKLVVDGILGVIPEFERRLSRFEPRNIVRLNFQVRRQIVYKPHLVAHIQVLDRFADFLDRAHAGNLARSSSGCEWPFAPEELLQLFLGAFELGNPFRAVKLNRILGRQTQSARNQFARISRIHALVSRRCVVTQAFPIFQRLVFVPAGFQDASALERFEILRHRSRLLHWNAGVRLQGFTKFLLLVERELRDFSFYLCE